MTAPAAPAPIPQYDHEDDPDPEREAIRLEMRLEALRTKAFKVYEEIAEEFSEATAVKTFAALSRQTSRRAAKGKQQFALARRLLTRPGEPNIYQLAKDIVAENKASRRGSTDQGTIEQQIRRAVKHAREFCEAKDETIAWWPEGPLELGVNWDFHEKMGVRFAGPG